MTERESFMKAIIDDPDNDQIRLVFADWLEEYGGEPERAEFIRLQIELAERNVKPYNLCWESAIACRIVAKDSSNLVHRCSNILVEFGQKWWQEGNYLINQLPIWKASWRRGFVSRIDCNMSQWREHGPAIVRNHPVQVVRIDDKFPFQHATEYDLYGKRYRIATWLTDSRYDLGARGENIIPLAIYNCLPEVIEDPVYLVLEYRSVDDALASLSKGCITWAKIPDEERE